MNEILETIGVAVVRISHLETQIAAQAAEIERLTAALAQADFKLSLAWPGVWQPIINETNINCVNSGRVMFVFESGGSIGIEDGDDSLTVDLPEGYAICRKVQP